jgi:hypothetical protein
MLLVKSQEVHYCQVVRRRGIESEIVPGLMYQNKLFIKGKSYPKKCRDEAQEYMRHKFLDVQTNVSSILVETERELTVWLSDDRVVLAIEKDGDGSDAEDPIAQIDLDYVIAQMRGIGGIKIKDRRYHLRVYAQCFIGSEAVDWMRDRLRISRGEAVRLGQRLMDAKHIHHVVDDHKFKDGHFFYRFYWDEDN